MRVEIEYGSSKYRAGMNRLQDGTLYITACQRFQRPYVISRPFGCVNLCTGEPHGQMTVGGRWVRVRRPSAKLSAALLAAAGNQS